MRKQKRGLSMASSSLTTGHGRLTAAAIGCGVAMVFGAWILSAASPDRLLERSYARVTPQGTLFLDDAGADKSATLPVTNATMADGTAVHQPLLVRVDGEPVPSGILSEPLAAGDQVEIGSARTDMRTVEVQEVAEMDAPVVGMPGVRLQLVTARSLDHRQPETLRLVFAVREASPAKLVPAVRPAADRVL